MIMDIKLNQNTTNKKQNLSKPSAKQKANNDTKFNSETQNNNISTDETTTRNLTIRESLQKGPREKWSFITHFASAILATFATLFLFFSNIEHIHQDTGRLITMTLFGLSMIVLYSCSSIYHFSNGSAKVQLHLRKLDHAMIYALIAGSYTPVLYNGFEAPKSTFFLIGIWAFMLVGVIVKLFWLNAPRWLSTAVYVIMGWSIIIDPKALFSLPSDFLILLLAGGISYTIGAILYVLKKPNFCEAFGFHEIFHCFITLGSAFHFVGLVLYL